MSYGNGQNSPKGFLPSTYLNGAVWDGQTLDYPIASGYATSIFTGDPVTTTNGYLAIGAAGTNPLVGVFQGVKYYDSTGNPQFSKYWPASTVTFQTQDAQAMIVNDANVMFDIQVDDSTGPHTHPYASQSNMGFNASFVLGSGSTATGLSSTYLDYTTINTGATLNLKLIKFVPVPGNGTPTSSAQWYNNVLVIINNHKYKGGTGTLGS